MITTRQTVLPADAWLELPATLVGLKSLSKGTIEVITKNDALTPPALTDKGDILSEGQTLDFAVTTVAYVKTLNSDREIVTYT